MEQLDRASLQMQQNLPNPPALGQTMGLQHVPDYALMPYELAEIEECSLSQEEAVRKGDDDVAAAMCHWQGTP